MKVKLSVIWNSIATISKLGNTTSTSAKSNYWIGRLTGKLRTEAKRIDEQRNELIKKYGKENEDKSFTVEDTKKEEFFKEFGELLDTEVEINLPQLELDYFEGRNISPEDMNTLNFAIKEQNG